MVAWWVSTAKGPIFVVFRAPCRSLTIGSRTSQGLPYVKVAVTCWRRALGASPTAGSGCGEAPAAPSFGTEDASPGGLHWSLRGWIDARGIGVQPPPPA